LDQALNLETIRNKTLRDIARKVEACLPVSEDDALFMLTTNDILELGLIASYVKRRLHGDRVFYSVNMNLNYTNVCELRCPICAFSRSEGEDGAYVLDLDEIEHRARWAASMGVDEIHIVGGLNRSLKLDYFEEMLRRIKRTCPDALIVAFTAVEYDFFAKENGIPLDEVFSRLIAAGLGALPGGGAEIFAPRIREVIAPRKISGRRWCEVMRQAHTLGLKTNATLLYNHLERPEDIVDHLASIRSLQDETGGFKTFVPLPYHETGSLVRAKAKTSTGYADIRLFAAARVFLHNVPHLKALWMYLGEKMAQTLLCFGADDLGGTYHHERVVHAAGAPTADSGSEVTLIRLIENAGMTPVRCAADYRERRAS